MIQRSFGSALVSSLLVAGGDAPAVPASLVPVAGVYLVAAFCEGATIFPTQLGMAAIKVSGEGQALDDLCAALGIAPGHF